MSNAHESCRFSSFWTIFIICGQMAAMEYRHQLLATLFSTPTLSVEPEPDHRWFSTWRDVLSGRKRLLADKGACTQTRSSTKARTRQHSPTKVGGVTRTVCNELYQNPIMQQP